MFRKGCSAVRAFEAIAYNGGAFKTPKGGTKWR